MLYTLETPVGATQYLRIDGEKLVDYTYRVQCLVNTAIREFYTDQTIRLWVNESSIVGHYSGSLPRQANPMIVCAADMITDAYNSGMLQYHDLSVMGFNVNMRMLSRHNVLTVRYGSYDASLTIWDTDSPELTDQCIRSHVLSVHKESATQIYCLQSMFDSMVTMFYDSYLNRMVFQAPITIYGVTMSLRQCMNYHEVTLTSALVRRVTHIYDGYDIEGEISATLGTMFTIEG